MPRGKSCPGAVTNSCNAPWKTVTVDYNGNCLLCTCDGWLPIPVGQVQDFQSLDDLFASPLAKILQKDIAEKKFTWCAVDHCGVRYHNITHQEYNLSINIDESCNLWCPSCRREQIMHQQGPEFEKKKKDVLTILKWLEACDQPITVTLSGNGDPLASGIIRPLFTHYIPKPGQKFILMTNGLLIKKQLPGSSMIDHIKRYQISTDAGSQAVYEQVRCGARWNVLIENLEFLVAIEKQSSVSLNFAIQYKNFRDIGNFIDLCERYGFTGTCHQLDDWGTWNHDSEKDPDEWTIKNGTYLQHNVLDKGHPDYLECKSIVSSKLANEYVRFHPRVLQLLELKNVVRKNNAGNHARSK
ncbi:MAG: hypothetical protein EB023_04370 [Flavobacteriia bacterium]|nr:hypothetical protein [Flavobacteriia bacterium]